MLFHSDVVDKLLDVFIEDPARGKSLATEYGIWDEFYSSIARPILIRRAKDDINVFIEHAFTDELGDPIVQQDFQREWHALIDTQLRTLIAAPRSHGKTTQIVARVVWELGRNCNLRVKILGSSDDKAQEIVGYIKEVIQDNEFCKAVFPDLVIDTSRTDTKSSFFVKRTVQQRDSSTEASGVLSAGAGGRADLLICDDVVDAKNSIINPALREQVIKAINETWFSLVSAKGRIVWVCTPYHIADATHHIKNTGAWVIWWTPAIQLIPCVDEEGNQERDENGEPKFTKVILFPDLWSEERLADRRVTIGERAFARQFLLQAMSDEERTFPEDSIKNSFDYNLSNIGEGVEDDWPTWAGIDLASALGKKNAYTVIWIIARNPETKRYHLKQMWRMRVKFPHTLRAIAELHKKHKWRMCKVESNQFQIAVVDGIKAQNEEALAQGLDVPQIPIEGFATGAYNKNSELIGLPKLNVTFEQGKWVIPAKRFPLAVDDLSDIAVFMNELQTHPGGEFSDTIMALWFAWMAAEAGTRDFEDAYIEAIGMEV